MNKILILANDYTTIYNFRRELLQRLLAEKYKVIISLPADERNKAFLEMGCSVEETTLSRFGTNPIKEYMSIKRYIRLIRKVLPDVVLAYTAKPNIYGSLACQRCNVPYINNVTGLGIIFQSENFIKKIMMLMQKKAYKKSQCVFFQNASNKKYFEEMKIVGANTCLLPGSGVNLELHKLEPYPIDDDTIRFILVSRVRKDKGFDELFEAIKVISEKTNKAEFHIVGWYEDDVYREKLDYMQKNYPVIYHGSRSQKEVHELISKCHCLIHPSYHEGMANVLLESAATGRPCMASNIPGCKEAIDDGVTGFLFDVQKSESLIKAIEKFMSLAYESKSQMGVLGRGKMEKEFDRQIVVNAYLKAIKKVLGESQEEKAMLRYEKIVNRQEKMSLIGLGYVGMPIAVAFATKIDVIGFDVNKAKINQYKAGIDPTKEVGNEVIKNTTVEFTSDEEKLREAKFHIVAVPTPVNADHTPDLTPVKSASHTLGRNLTKGSIVVYESTVYPGVTEDICVPILEQESGLKCGVDFKVGYSPERINPGDKKHRLNTIVKIVSGMDEEALDIIAKVYELVVDAGVYRAECIKVAEAAKVIENSQRDINIAFMNELSIIFNKMGIDTNSVLKAAGTKWNFLNFRPGLVGGHCIGVDPYYLTYKAEELGYHSQIILSGRKINDDMGKYVAENTVKKMIKANKQINRSKVAIFGITFKENCPDVRNTKVIDIIKELEEYGIEVKVVDPVADKEGLLHEYKINICNMDDIKDIDAAIFAVIHEEFKMMKLCDINKMYKTSVSNYPDAMDEVAAVSEESTGNTGNVLIDVKGIFDKKEAEDMNYIYWRL